MHDHETSQFHFLGLLFFGLFIYWFVSETLVKSLSLLFLGAYAILYWKNTHAWARLFLLTSIFSLLILVPILYHGMENADYKYSDILAGTQAATELLVDGKNPYAESYYGTILEKAMPYNQEYWKEQGTNYLIMDHFSYTPGIFGFSVPFEWLFPSQSYAWLLAVLLIVAYAIVLTQFPNPEKWIPIIFLNPLFYFGWSLLHVVDYAALTIVLLAIASWNKGSKMGAGFLFGWVFALKAYFLIALPFLVWGIFHRKEWKLANGMVLSLILFFVPFLFWNPAAFWEDQAIFFLGSGKNTISIWSNHAGFFPLLVRTGIISSTQTQGVLPLMIGIFLACFLFFIRSFKQKEVSHIFAWAAVTSLLVLFFSKHFLNNYWTLPFILALPFWLMKREK